MVGRVRPERVRVNAVSPGPTRTEGTEVMGDQASFVHGAILDVDGGRNAA